MALWSRFPPLFCCVLLLPLFSLLGIAWFHQTFFFSRWLELSTRVIAEPDTKRWTASMQRKSLRQAQDAARRQEISPWAFLEPTFSAHCQWDSPVWKSYVSMHRRMQKGEESPRYLIHKPPQGQGLGHLIAGLEFSFYAALFSRRALLVDWTSPLDLKTMFEPREVDWRRESHPLIGEMNASQRLQVLNYQPIDPKDVMRVLDESWPIVEVQSNSGISGYETIDFSMLDHPNVTLESWLHPWTRFRGCAFHSLLRLKSDAKLATFWSGVERMVPQGPRIGVHVRYGDHVFSQDHGDVREVLDDQSWGLQSIEMVAFQSIECAQQLAMQFGWAPPCVIIFESDSHIAKAVAFAQNRKHKYERSQCVRQMAFASPSRAMLCKSPCEVWVSKFVPHHTALEKGDRVALETWTSLFMLSAVQNILYTGSSFGMTAGLLGPSLTMQHRAFRFDEFLGERALLKRGKDEIENLCFLGEQHRHAQY